MTNMTNQLNTQERFQVSHSKSPTPSKATFENMMNILKEQFPSDKQGKPMELSMTPTILKYLGAGPNKTNLVINTTTFEMYYEY